MGTHNTILSRYRNLITPQETSLYPHKTTNNARENLKTSDNFKALRPRYLWQKISQIASIVGMIDLVKNLDDSVLKQGLEKLNTFAKNPAKKPRSVLEEFLKQNRKLVTQALANGHTYRDIAAGLREAGFSSSPETIRRHIHRVIGTTKKARMGEQVDHEKTSQEPQENHKPAVLNATDEISVGVQEVGEGVAFSLPVATVR